MRSFKSLTLVIISAFVLAACGLKGPLYLPSGDADGSPAAQQKNDTDKKDADRDRQDDEDG